MRSKGSGWPFASTFAYFSSKPTGQGQKLDPLHVLLKVPARSKSGGFCQILIKNSAFLFKKRAKKEGLALRQVLPVDLTTNSPITGCGDGPSTSGHVSSNQSSCDD